MNTYIIYALIFIFGFLLGILLMAFKLHSKSSKLKLYQRKLEKESISNDNSESRVKVLESKIAVLEKALENALKK